MSDESRTKRTLRIKTGIVNRLTKELVSYMNELNELDTKYEQLLKMERAEEWDKKNTKNILEETVKVAGQIRYRLKAAMDDLRSYVDSLDKNDRDNIHAELEIAKNVLGEAVPQVQMIVESDRTLTRV